MDGSSATDSVPARSTSYTQPSSQTRRRVRLQTWPGWARLLWFLSELYGAVRLPTLMIRR